MKRMRPHLLLAMPAIATLLSVAMMPSGARAAILKADDFWVLYQTTEVSILNYENLVDHNGTANIIEEGDTLRGIIHVLSRKNPLPDGPDANKLELTGIFEIEVLAKADVGFGLFTYRFGPHTGFATEFGFPTGTMLALYEELNPTAATKFDHLASDSEFRATTGNLYVTLGSTGVWGTDYYWAAYGSQNIKASGVLAHFAGILDVLSQPGTNLVFEPVVKQDPPLFFGGLGLESIEGQFGIQGTATGGGFGSYYDVKSDDPAKVYATPEPVSLAVWLALTTLAFGSALARRRRGPSAR